MPYRLTIKPPVLVSLNDPPVDSAELRRSSGTPVAYVSLLPASGHVFTEEAQSVFLGFFHSILAHCATVHHIIEGDGFLKSGRLAIVTKLALGTARPRDFHTHSSLDDAARLIKSLYGVDLGNQASMTSVPPPERASGAFRAAVRIVDARRPPPRKG